MESLLAASLFFISLLVLCEASLLEVVELWASAGFAGVVACDISFGTALSSVFGVVLSGWGVVLVSGVVVVEGVVVVVVELLVALLEPGVFAGFAQG
jgi:hypothetical protein